MVEPPHESLTSLSARGVFSTAAVQRILLALLTFVLSKAWYSAYLSPLATYPGPKLYACSKLPINYHHIKGSVVKRLRELHEKYGPVVRIGPSELSYIDPAAWKDIYGPKTSTGGQMPKDPAFYLVAAKNVVCNIDNDLSDESHARQRKVFSQAFSDRALREQEGLIGTYVDKLIVKLDELASPNGKAKGVVDMVRMLNFTTFDIMSDLAFGEPLHLLDQNGYHEWVATIFDNLHALAIMLAISQFPLIKSLVNALVPPSLKRQRDKHSRFSHDRVDARLAKKTTRPDIWSLVIAHQAENSQNDWVKREEMYANSSLFMVAGTETTATLLSGLLYLLLTHEEVMQSLKEEVRALEELDITMLQLPRLHYLNACIEEALRIYPPVPGGLPRKTPAGGAVIAGRFVPGDVVVSIPHYPAYHSSVNFTSPDMFAPERWLGPSTSAFEEDKRHVLNPFSAGPRNCLGQNLAYHEMRLILAKLIWNFDFAIDEATAKDWMDQRVLLFWEKKPLMVKVKKAARE